MPQPLRRTMLALLLTAATISAPPALAASRGRAPALADLSGRTAAQVMAEGSEALRTRDSRRAIHAFSELAAREPRNGTAQALLGLSYQLASAGDPQAMDMALAGYDLAIRAEPGQYWPSAMAGRGAFDMGKYDEALNHFARAALLRPNDAPTLSAVAATAYMTGDIALASLAAGRAAELDAGEKGENLRLAVIAAAAAGDAALVAARMETLAARFPALAGEVRARADNLLATAALDGMAGEGEGGSDPAALVAPDQVSLDVAIILSQNTQRERSGFNLLDGLSLQYGTGRTSQRTISSENDVRTGNSYQRVLTASISVPQINYNLNLFNRGGQFYSVVARPQLTAYRGEQSEFFVGRTLRVAVNGVNSSSLEQVDVGIELKVTPMEITPTGTRVRIEAGRSFLTSDPAGTFAEALTTFRQRVAATAEIRFGETLLLSGLNEAVEDRTYSKTPLLGDMPVVGNAFNERNSTQRRDSVLVLVTPARPLSLAGRPFARADAVASLARLWSEVVDPRSNAAATAADLSRMRMFTRMTRGDATMSFPDRDSAAGRMISELIVPGSP